MVKRSSGGLAAASAFLGLLAALGVVSMGLLGGRGGAGLVRVDHSATELLAVKGGAAAGAAASAGVRARMAGAIASSHSARLTGTMSMGHMLAALDDSMISTNSAGNATEEPPCKSWRGCGRASLVNYTSLPSDVQFECGGKEASTTCWLATKACVRSAETSLTNMYIVSPILGTEATGGAVCKCFISNGCKPGCNVAMYQRWSVRSAMNCPAQPPILHKSTGVYQYGDTTADYVPSSDLSFDYYPEYPNPGGHTYNQPWARNTYERQPAIGMYPRPLYATYGRGIEHYTADSGTGYNPFSGWRTDERPDVAWESGLSSPAADQEEAVEDYGV